MRSSGAETGTATIEFALLLPVLLFMVLLLTQVTFLMVGNLFVHYAAFAAARAAVVQLPGDQLHQAGQVNIASDPAKLESIRLAAAYALVPVAGRLNTGMADAHADLLVGGLTAFYGNQGKNVPHWVTGGMAAQRLRYALDQANTVVYLKRAVASGVRGINVAYQPTGVAGLTVADPREALTVFVTHRLNLAIPYVNRFFADGRSADGRSMYTNVTAHCSLTNEGLSEAMINSAGVPGLYGKQLPRNP